MFIYPISRLLCFKKKYLRKSNDQFSPGSKVVEISKLNNTEFGKINIFKNKGLKYI